ncbi:MAG TPA: PfkB family carbohydrate kinase [Elusimicrobiota bacterium]|nr:PfkB family carbohydrate kinase [Elusimicrobiota bacterium]
MSVVVVGSVALDSIRTPFGECTDALGGSATYFSYSASFFTSVKLVGVVGKDFPKEHVELLKRKKVDLAGLQIVDGETFRWSGFYEYDMNEAKTLATHLNVFERFRPILPEDYKTSDCVFLANIDPDLQLDVLNQVRKPKLIAADTMNLWISTKKERIIHLCKHVHILILNDGEARQLTGHNNVIKAGRTILSWGPRYVVVKKGSHGALLFTKDKLYSVPAYPLENVFDPTGAGDTFAGGFVGYLNREKNALNDKVLHHALFYGTAMASFNVEKFSLERLKTVSKAEIEKRMKELHNMTSLVKYKM